MKRMLPTPVLLRFQVQVISGDGHDLQGLCFPVMELSVLFNGEA